MPSFFLAAVLIAVVGSCGESSRRPVAKSNLAFDSVVVDTVIKVEGKYRHHQAEVKLNVKYAKGDNSRLVNDTIIASAAVNGFYFNQSDYPAVDGDVCKAVANHVDAFGNYYRNAVRENDENDYDIPLDYTLNVNTQVRKGRDGVVNYLVDRFAYFGEGSGWALTQALNFDVATGKRINRHDFFVKGSDESIFEAIVADMFHLHGRKKWKDLADKGEIFFHDVYVPDDFILGPDSVTFIYQSDKIGVMGCVDVRCTLAYDDLIDYIAD